MNPKLRILIEDARLTHTPTYCRGANIAPLDYPWCESCVRLIPHKDCPVLKAADELEKEHDSI
jgi:hypothetical protein